MLGSRTCSRQESTRKLNVLVPPSLSWLLNLSACRSCQPHSPDLKETLIADMDGRTPGEPQDMNTVVVVSRRGWNAVEARDRTEMKNPAQAVIVHHTALRYCGHPRDSVSELAHIQHMHMQERGFDDIGYNFLISGDGMVYEGRGWGIVGAHAKEHNFNSVGIAFMGNFNDEFPSSASKSALLRLLHIGVLHGHVQPNFVLVGHRDVAKTECPGKNVYAALPKLNLSLHKLHSIPSVCECENE